MNESSVAAQETATEQEQVMSQPACTIHVCTSCRPPGTRRDPLGNTPGFLFYKELRDAIADSAINDRVDVKPTECLSVCPRPCGFAVSLPGAWTYLFGDQKPAESAPEVLDCIALYLDSPDGFMPRSQRPKSLRGSILGRVPPIQGAGQCT